jgi:hypothetical protein
VKPDGSRIAETPASTSPFQNSASRPPGRSTRRAAIAPATGSIQCLGPR